MCQGYFESGRPKLKAILFSQTLNITQVKFLLDTGADDTSITLRDAQLLGVNLDEVVTDDNRIIVEGIGGNTDIYPIRDTIAFVFIDSYEEVGKTSYHIEFLDKIDLIPTLPISLLGRDLLNRFDIEISTVPEKVNLKRNDFGGSGHICFSYP